MERDALDGAKCGTPLTASASALLATLRRTLHLWALTDYPHVLNRMADLWGDAREMNRYFDDLLLDARGDRRGFPLKVIAEITRVRDHYQARVSPVQPQTDVWSTMHLR
jgi:hypothetical protein